MNENPTATPFVPDLLHGRVGLVTGGGTGIGRAISLALARHGCDLMLVSRSREHLDAAAADIRALGRRAEVAEADVRDSAALSSAFERTAAELGGLDILVNNAAGNFLVPAAELSENGWRAVVDIVLTGTFNASRAAYPLLLERNGGSIINITTTYVDTGAPFMAHSGAAKAGVLNLTRSLAVEWGGDGIRVNAVAPGLVEGTEGARRLAESIGFVEPYRRSVPLGRLTRADDVASAVLFLVGPAAGHITGIEIVVDGGASLGGHFKAAAERLSGTERDSTS